jgi:thioredoxin-like negative regulator of GroEL
MRPVVHRLEADYWGKVDFVYVDREDSENSKVVDMYGISAQPVFILIEPDGTEVQRWFGRVSPDDLRQAMEQYLSS